MERLTEDYNDSYCLKKCHPNNDCFCDGRGCPIDNCGVVIEALNKLGEYEKAEEQGLLVKVSRVKRRLEQFQKDLTSQTIYKEGLPGSALDIVNILIADLAADEGEEEGQYAYEKKVARRLGSTPGRC